MLQLALGCQSVLYFNNISVFSSACIKAAPHNRDLPDKREASRLPTRVRRAKKEFCSKHPHLDNYLETKPFKF